MARPPRSGDCRCCDRRCRCSSPANAATTVRPQRWHDHAEAGQEDDEGAQERGHHRLRLDEVQDQRWRHRPGHRQGHDRPQEREAHDQGWQDQGHAQQRSRSTRRRAPRRRRPARRPSRSRRSRAARSRARASPRASPARRSASARRVPRRSTRPSRSERSRAARPSASPRSRRRRTRSRSREARRRSRSTRRSSRRSPPARVPPSAVAPATLDAATLTLNVPVNGGVLDARTLTGRITHDGGLQLGSIPLTGLEVVLGNPAVLNTSVGAIADLDLAGLQTTVDPATRTIGGTGVILETEPVRRHGDRRGRAGAGRQTRRPARRSAAASSAPPRAESRRDAAAEPIGRRGLMQFASRPVPPREGRAVSRFRARGGAAPAPRRARS